MSQFSGISRDEIDADIRNQLVDRRARLAAVPDLSERQDYRTLLREVDSALERIDDGTFGECEHCHDEIEQDRLIRDPLIRVCLDCLSDTQQRALERDLELAATVQQGLLPPEHVHSCGWEIEHRYLPFGPVSGDYCDVLSSDTPDTPTHVMLGDVAGKGVSASILMAHLHATFRSLASLNLSLAELARRSNRIFCDGIASGAFATLLLARLWPDGRVEMFNAGHCPPLRTRGGKITPLAATGLPLGLFCESQFEIEQFRLSQGDSLFLYTDGLSEAANGADEQFGTQRIERIVRGLESRPAGSALRECLNDVERFRGGAAMTDDLTVMTVRRTT